MYYIIEEEEEEESVLVRAVQVSLAHVTHVCLGDSIDPAARARDRTRPRSLDAYLASFFPCGVVA